VEKRGLPEGAYGVKPGQTYVPYVPAEKVMPEFTVYSIVLGVILSVIFGAAKVRKRQPEIAFPQIAKKGVLCGKYHPAKVQKRKRPPGWAIFLFTRDRQGGLPSRCGELQGAWAA